ncbi:unnamed protein product [Anisakis simplex]|uniref:Uncharacterized protein n=1 Tax=Anisakis simplex TaxID=6269 RepID=A0A0M3JCN5_ANISI|nr:unnamed protein product [Anisakis simplex]
MGCGPIGGNGSVDRDQFCRQFHTVSVLFWTLNNRVVQIFSSLCYLCSHADPTHYVDVIRKYGEIAQQSP